MELTSHRGVEQLELKEQCRSSRGAEGVWGGGGVHMSMHICTSTKLHLSLSQPRVGKPPKKSKRCDLRMRRRAACVCLHSRNSQSHCTHGTPGRYILLSQSISLFVVSWVVLAFERAQNALENFERWFENCTCARRVRRPKCSLKSRNGGHSTHGPLWL